MKLFEKINWIDIIFPLFADLRNINNEAGSVSVIDNNRNLANDPESYDRVMNNLIARSVMQNDISESESLVTKNDDNIYVIVK